LTLASSMIEDAPETVYWKSRVHCAPYPWLASGVYAELALMPLFSGLAGRIGSLQPSMICAVRHDSHSTSSGLVDVGQGGAGGGGGSGGGRGAGQGLRRGRRSYVQLPCFLQLGWVSRIVTRLQSALMTPVFTTLSFPNPGQLESPKLNVRFEPTTMPLARFHPSEPEKHCSVPSITVLRVKVTDTGDAARCTQMWAA
jgi:hypothetical protein